MIKLIVFDWDDVITLGAKEAYFTCYHKVLTEIGIYLTPEEEQKRILAKWSKPHREELKELLKEHPELLDQACKIYKKEKDTIFLRSLQMAKGTNEVLLRLKQEYILTVATGNTLEMVRNAIMPHFQIPRVFSQIISSHDIHDVNKMKPHPYMLELIMKKQNVTPQETIFVGDALTDVQMARNAEVTPVVVLTGHLSREEAKGLHIKWIIPDITHLPRVLYVINKQN